MRKADQCYRMLGLALLSLATSCNKPTPATNADTLATMPTETFAIQRSGQQGVPIAAATPDAKKIVLGPDLLPVSDRVLFRVDRPLGELTKQWEFGIFREPQERSVQWIEEAVAIIDGPWVRPSKWLKIHYEVPAGSNGWSLNLKGEDWTAAAEGALVLRLRVDGDAQLTFNLELTTGSAHVYAHRIELNPEAYAEIERCGFKDFPVSLREWVGNASLLKKVDELRLVFDHNHVKQKTGDLYLHSIRLALPATPAPKDADHIMGELAERSFRWFAANRHPRTGLVLDRCPNQSTIKQRPTMCSIAAVGYYLSMLPDAVRIGQIDEREAVRQAEDTLSFILHRVPHQQGLLPHFLNWETAKVEDWSEYSALDTSIFLNGCCVVSEAFGGKVREMSDQLLDRVNWKALLVRDPKSGKELLSFGWSPKKDLLGPMWERSSEMAIAYCLAIGSRTHAVDPELWYRTATQYGNRHGYELLNPTHGLFTSYYGLGWTDLRGLVDRDHLDLEGNAKTAALANRAFCRHACEKRLTYQQRFGGWWGISAGDSPRGYIAPGLVESDIEGTVWPAAALAAWPWARSQLKEDLARWRSSDMWPIVLGPYGLAPFNLDAQWIAPDLLAIDLGSFFINYENDQAGTVRRLWMKHPVSAMGIKKLSLRSEKGREVGVP